MKRNLIVTLMIAALIAVPVGQAGQAAAAARAKSAPARAPAAAISPTDPTKVPHYFGPYPNWANTPQVLSDAIVTISGGGATGAGATATATVDPKLGGITTVAVTTPGSGYTSAPTVAFTAPGALSASGAAATAAISAGVIKSIAVNEAGFGFTTPSVTIAGGAPSLNATATASGGVDNLNLTSGGTGYVNNPIVKIGLPDLTTGTQATATAVMNTSGVVTSLNVVTPGSGYTKAPTVDVTDAAVINPTGAVVAATIGIGQIDVTSGGTGYTSAPTVTITDSVVPFDKGATATATIAALGAVTDVTVTAAGSGYLTPGLKKFVDTLPGLGPNAANDLGQYIPIAVPDTTTYPGADYYEIAVVQYRMQFHKDLPATLLRGYVQLSTSVIPGRQVALTNANLDPLVAPTPIANYSGVDNPHYLGPTIVATKNRPVRVLFRNLLPSGVGGDLFLPVDTSVAGSGPGPAMTTLDANGVPVDTATNLGTVTDGVRNPACGETPKPTTCYSENRATLHLHGGITPWISDGTPHQWTTPAGETTSYPKGVSVSNVPDMPDPGPGAETFFYTNQQSARMMFYHDHSWGITRLNVYAGEAAGYLVTDPTEQALTAPGGALDGLGLGTPLIIQDKTFVPSAATMAQQDPTWNYSKWGGAGNLWTPHVYMPAQNPSSPSGSSAFGRWMYGPWFWPPAKDAKYPPIANPYYDPTCNPNTAPFCEPAEIPSTPNVSVGMEAFNDTPIVNGTAYPTTTVDPKAYRYQILNAANDRFWNLQWYVADPTTGTLSEVALKAPELAAAQTDPNVVPTPDLTKSPVGPSWIQIGTEGGFLPAPVVVPSQPTTWIIDPTRFDFGNVDKHALVLGPAERADVIVDFSQFRGKTLILYNDAPAAYPGRISNYDYYTGGPDLTSSGGAPTTLPGYGPNTRTIMQVKVSSAAPAVAFDRPNTTADQMGALQAAFAHHLDAAGKPAGVFEAGSDPIIVGQAAYNGALGTSFTSAGYCSSPTTPTAKCDGFARIQQQGGDLFKFDTVAGPQVSIPLQPKALHDETNSANFDDWGRMSANLGLEAPGATPLLQNIILFPYVNPATELLDSTGTPSSLKVTPISTGTDGTQIWKITHNGVDTHPMHFHLYDVQVLNRVTWDNIMMPPDANELGWKETVRLSPLEDTIVAVRPIVPTLPFGVPDSIRPLNPSLPIGAKGSTTGNGTQAGFNNTDNLGNPIAPIENVLTNFGWEYVWHCHILSHEEMDMMRPVTVKVTEALPAAPVLTFTRGGVILAWTDGTPVDYANPSSWTNPGTAEVGYRIDRALVDPNGLAGAFTQIGTSLANVVTYTDNPVDPTNTYDYRVTAWNAAGDSPSNVVRVPGAPKAPTGLTAVVAPAATLPAGSQVNVSWTNNATNAANVIVESAVGTGTFSVIATLPATATSYVDTSVVPGTYSYRVKAVSANGSSLYAGPVSVVVPQPGSTTTVLNAPNPSTVGQAVTFTATVSSVLASGTPTGSIIFTVNGVANAPTSLSATGGAAFSTSTLPAGANTITATYSGDAIFLASNASVTQTVNKFATTTVVVSTLNPSLVGQPVTFTATVSGPTGAGTPSGSVDFIANGTTTTVPLTAGVATLTTSTLPAGTYTVTANYSGDATFLVSTATVIQAVNVTPTTTKVASSLNPSLVGQPVTFTATVVPPPAVAPSETVTFTVNGVITPVALDIAGVATLTTSALAAGSYNITAAYSGDAALSPSSGAVTQVVNKTATATVVVSNLNPSVAGQPVTFTATVSPSTAYGTAATGTVNFSIDGVSYPVAISAGQAIYTTSALAPGGHVVSASYSGDAAFAASSSTAFTQTVGPVLVASKTVVTSNRVPSSTFRQTVTFTATASAVTGLVIPSGTVQFTIDGLPAGGVLALNAQGRATYSTATLTAGSHTVIAVYSGSTVFAGSGSATLTQVVNQSVATVTVSSNRIPSSFGQAVTFTARVNTLLATGNVVFTIDGAVYPGPVTLDATGRARLVVSSLAVGLHTVSATYGGSVNFLPSTSANFTQTVTTAASRTRLTTSGTPAAVGTPVVFTASVTLSATRAAAGTGTVQFLVNGVNVGGPAALNSSSQATYVTSTMAAGTYTVTAIYSGDANLNTSTARAMTQQIR